MIFYIAEPKRGWPLTYVSENIQNIAGVKPSALVKEHDGITKRIHPDDRKGSRPTLKRLRQEGAHESEFRFAMANGEYRQFRESAQLKKENGHEWIVGTLIDIESGKEQPDTHSGDELVRRVLEACPVPIRMTRLDNGEILYESPSSREAYGGDPEKAPKSVLEHYVDPA
ncbi:MAG: PAS domain-containing protein, partial [Methyloligellaceae bacterium]